MSSEALETAELEFRAGQRAYEGGHYRQSVAHLEKARSLVEGNSRLGSDILLWLVTALDAAGERSDALALGKKLSRHPRLETRLQARRLVYIMEAPKLETNPDWVVKIPDLTRLEDNQFSMSQISAAPTPSRPKKQKLPEPIDLSQVNTQDNRFIGVALIVILVTLAGLGLWSH